MKRLSSTRRRLAPMPPILISSSAWVTWPPPMPASRSCPGPVGRPQHRLDDVLVAGAPTELPDSAHRTSSSVGSGFSSRRALAVNIIPGVQNPHCRPCSSLNPSWIGCSSLAVANPSTVITSWPSAWTASIVQLLTGRPSNRTVQAPQLVVSHPVCVPVSLKPDRSRWASMRRGSTTADRDSPLTRTVILRTGMSSGVAAGTSSNRLVISGGHLLRVEQSGQDPAGEDRTRCRL